MACCWSTHPGPSGTPQSCRWKSFSSIRSDQQAWWLCVWFLRPVTEELCCGRLTDAKCSESSQTASIWTELSLIRLSAWGSFLLMGQVYAPPSSLPPSTPHNTLIHPQTLTLAENTLRIYIMWCWFMSQNAYSAHVGLEWMHFLY